MNKKAMIREYRETVRPAGIYCIRNLINGKVFVGKSVDLPAIVNRQTAQIRSRTHPNPNLQKDLIEFGAEAFAVEVLDTLEAPNQSDYDPADLNILEQLWLDKLSPYGTRGYNPEPK